MGRKVGLLSPCNKKETDRKGKRNKGNLTLSGFSGNEKVTYGTKFCGGCGMPVDNEIFE